MKIVIFFYLPTSKHIEDWDSYLISPVFPVAPVCPGQLSWVMALGSERHRGRGLEIRVGIPVSGTIYYDTQYSDDNNTAENNFNIITPTAELIQLPRSLNFEVQYLSLSPLFLAVIIRVAQGVMVAQGNTWPDSASRDTDRGEIGIKLSLICNDITLWALPSRIIHVNLLKTLLEIHELRIGFTENAYVFNFRIYVCHFI